MGNLSNNLLWTGLVVGFVTACVAWYGRYRILPAFLTGPQTCQLEAGGCQALFRSQNAILLGVPNSLLGVLYYPLLGVGILMGWPMVLLFGASTFSLLMTLWLAWVLVRDGLECRVCWTGHACNTAIWAILLTRLLA